MRIFNTFKHHQKECIFQTQILIQMMKSSFVSSAAQGSINCRDSSTPDFIQNDFLLKCMSDFFDNHDECRKPGFLWGNINTSCISMVLLDHFANKSNTFLSPPLSLSLSRSPISSHFLLGSPLPPIPDSRIVQLMVPWWDCFKLISKKNAVWHQ